LAARLGRCAFWPGLLAFGPCWLAHRLGAHLNLERPERKHDQKRKEDLQARCYAKPDCHVGWVDFRQEPRRGV
jgi:hypothetical protein